MSESIEDREERRRALRTKIYVASSWRNTRQPEIVSALRRVGHEVYDFKNPKEGNSGFGWKQCTPVPVPWKAETFAEVMKHQVAIEGLRLDETALREADATVLVMPCGRSAHLELGVAIGLSQRTFVLLDSEPFEPELMWGMAELVTDKLGDILAHLRATPL